jgi:hypothetical protein
LHRQAWREKNLSASEFQKSGLMENPADRLGITADLCLAAGCGGQEGHASASRFLSSHLKGVHSSRSPDGLSLSLRFHLVITMKICDFFQKSERPEYQSAGFMKSHFRRTVLARCFIGRFLPTARGDPQ